MQSESKRKRPRGVMERTAVVFPGVHANADYFDIIEGVAVWNRNWSYSYLGETHSFKVGEKLGNTMMQLQLIKKAFPELTRKYLIVQQPAAFRDGIIVGWCMEDLHNRRKHLLMQHDLVGCQGTKEVKELRFLYQQPDTTINADMTACSQLTDIMIAHPGKVIARKKMPEIRQWMKTNARLSGKKLSYKVGFLEMLMLVDAIDEGLRQWLNEFDFIFHGARQGGHLAYLPDMVQKKLVTVEEAAVHWPDMPVPAGKEPKDAEPKVPKLGGGKLNADWLRDRYSWRDESGVPKEPCWKEMDADVPQKDIWKYDADAEDCITMPMETEVDGVVTQEEQDIFNENAAMLQMHPAVRRATYTEMWKKLQEAKGEDGKAVKKKLKEKKPSIFKKSEKIRRAGLPSSGDWRDITVQRINEGYTAEALAERVQLQAKPKGKARASGAAQLKMYTTSGAICLKAAGNKLKEKLTSKKASAKLVKEKGPMVGKMLKLCKDMSVLSD